MFNTFKISKLNLTLVFFFLVILLPPRSTLFPYTTLFRSLGTVYATTVLRRRDEPPANLALVDVDERSEEHTSELQSRGHLVCRLLLEKKKNPNRTPSPRIKHNRSGRRQ